MHYDYCIKTNNPKHDGEVLLTSGHGGEVDENNEGSVLSLGTPTTNEQNGRARGASHEQDHVNRPRVRGGTTHLHRRYTCSRYTLPTVAA